ncbi:threonine-phosphate decarboxylase [Thalassospira sp. HF15]|uniref:threonine-phosphate decarboxylase CobD n=1 Tax=Thalassospira sp. HF15 TaxID=2722755 RepID=UPI00143049EA|nr:threonine-phosphate decarboxylase CobD [Thalassospira sp. HF15]NIY76251.1 threonine-phosphate decarboxylase [Thalassospira sp. HF15]
MTKDLIHPKPEAPINHGGAIDRAAQRYGIPAIEWLDLSTGINPLAYPVRGIDGAHWQRLPLATELDALKQAAQAYYQTPTTKHIVCAPGTQALIQTIPFWLKDRMASPTEPNVHIMGPTYGEHERCWLRACYPVDNHQTIPNDRCDRAKDILRTADAGTVVVQVNPNNPDGAIYPPTDIIALGQLAATRDCWLVVDEAFMDCEPNQSVCRYIDQLPTTIILRSFGKFFGLAGARLGCAIMDIDLARDLENRIGPWAIPGPTLVVGTQALLDQSWQQDTRTRLSNDAARLDQLVTENSKLKLSGGTDLFRYYQGTDCKALADHLGQKGILVRLFDHDANKVRFGLPGTAADWKRLEEAMAALG